MVIRFFATVSQCRLARASHLARTMAWRALRSSSAISLRCAMRAAE
jgi:hypothetical protein